VLNALRKLSSDSTRPKKRNVEFRISVQNAKPACLTPLMSKISAGDAISTWDIADVPNCTSSIQLSFVQRHVAAQLLLQASAAEPRSFPAALLTDIDQIQLGCHDCRVNATVRGRSPAKKTPLCAFTTRAILSEVALFYSAKTVQGVPGDIAT
jgi:hypothetical protein